MPEVKSHFSPTIGLSATKYHNDIPSKKYHNTTKLVAGTSAVFYGSHQTVGNVQQFPPLECVVTRSIEPARIPLATKPRSHA